MKELEFIFRLEEAIKESKDASYRIGENKLYPVEIHILTEIKKDPNIGVVGLSEKLKVTKSAVSQKIKVLCDKEYLELKEQVGKQKFYKVTENGEKICKVHDRVGQVMVEDLFSMIKAYSKEEREAFCRIIEDITKYFETLDLSDDIREALENDH